MIKLKDNLIPRETKYIIKNWAGDEMPWGSFESIDQAYDEIEHKVAIELILEGQDQYLVGFDLMLDDVVCSYHVVNNKLNIR